MAAHSPSPVFYYDLNSPFAWLAAERINAVLPRAPVWRPIAYAFVIRHTGTTPWSMKPGREVHMEEIERRAAGRGLPPLRWPSGWPARTSSLPALRAAVFAARLDRVEAFSLAAFREQFNAGHGLNELETVRRAAIACGLDPDAVEEAVQEAAIKEELKRATEQAIADGVSGVPTVQVEEQLFWGDDRLEEAADAIQSSQDATRRPGPESRRRAES